MARRVQEGQRCLGAGHDYLKCANVLQQTPQKSARQAFRTKQVAAAWSNVLQQYRPTAKGSESIGLCITICHLQVQGEQLVPCPAHLSQGLTGPSLEDEQTRKLLMGCAQHASMIDHQQWL